KRLCIAVLVVLDGHPRTLFRRSASITSSPSGSHGAKLDAFSSGDQVVACAHEPPPRAGREGNMKADYVIIGAGSAGCALANRLSEDPGVQVLLIEAGGRDWSPYIHIPAGFMKLL